MSDNFVMPDLDRTGQAMRVENIEARFLRHVDKTDTCWNWTAATEHAGYGRFTDVGRQHILAHRWSYARYVGPIPEGLQIDHPCRNRGCVNPAHLEAVTLTENNRRKVASKTHCVQGHELTPENTYRRLDGRRCRTCSIAATRVYQQKRKLAMSR